jgi:hypothetical protein
MRRLVAGVLGVAVLGCSGSSGVTVDTAVNDADQKAGIDESATDSVPADPAPTDQPSDEADGQASAPSIPLPAGEAVVDGAANSLVLVFDRADGVDTLASYRADGALVATYTSDPGVRLWQPIWSPDGRRVAWAETDDGAEWRLVTTTTEGGDRSTHPLPGRPDYLTYGPAATKVFALTPSPEGFGLAVVDVTSEQPYEVLDVGAPYYSDISPGGDRLIAHVGPTLRLVELDGSTRALEVGSTGHQTPIWHPTDELLYFTIDAPAGSSLVAHDPASGDTDVVAALDDFALLALDPTGQRLAVSVLGPATGGTTRAFRSSPSPEPSDPLGSGLWLIDTEDGEAVRIADRPTIAPLWDPTGSQLLVRTSVAGEGRWRVHTLDGTSTGTDELDVDESFLPGYLPFWDQYVRSQTLWSPDGAHFTHVGRRVDGVSGVWIHTAGSDGPSRFLVEGDLAFWSPT